MKRFIFLLTLGVFISSCQKPSSAELPADLDGLKTVLKEKKASLKSLEKEIEEIESSISELEPPVEKSKKAVTTIIAKADVFNSYSELQGNIESSEAVMISAEMGGRITSLTINEGDYVSKGQVVGTVDMETVRKSLQEIQTSLELANTVFERQKKLWDQNIGSEIQYLQAKNNKERLEKSLETLKSQLNKESIVSPMSGYVEMKFLKAGEMTAPGTPIASVINTSSVKAVIDVPENLIGKVKKGDKVSLSFPALGIEKEARVNLVGRSINSANRTFKIEINLNNSEGLLKPNLLVLAKINDKTFKDAIAVPVELVQQDISGTSFVYTVAQGEEGLYAQKNIVETGISYDGKIIVLSGLTNGDELINKGARGLAEQDLIDIKNEDK